MIKVIKKVELFKQTFKRFKNKELLNEIQKNSKIITLVNELKIPKNNKILITWKKSVADINILKS